MQPLTCIHCRYCCMWDSTCSHPEHNFSPIDYESPACNLFEKETLNTTHMTYEFNQDYCHPSDLVLQIKRRQEAGWEFVSMAGTPNGHIYTIYRRPITGTDHK